MQGSEGSKGSQGSKGGGIAFGDEYKVSVTGFTLVATILHDEEPKPPSSGRRWRRQATEDRGVSSLLIFSVFLRASPSSIPVGQAKGKPFYGQSEGQLCPTWQSYAGLPTEEGALRYGFYLCVSKAAWRSARAPFPRKEPALCFYPSVSPVQLSREPAEAMTHI